MMNLEYEVRKEIEALKDIMYHFNLTGVDELCNKLDTIYSMAENHLVNIDQSLFETHSEIRREILKENLNHYLLWKSPQIQEFVNLSTSVFEYERGRTTEKLEERYKKLNNIKGEVLFFRSGMSILDNIFKLVSTLYRQPNIVQNSYYYENYYLSRNCYSHLDITYTEKYQDLYQHIKDSSCNVIITELVNANTMMDKLDIDEMIESINQSKTNMIILAIDTTLWCEEIDWNEVVSKVNKKCILLIYRSFLKLDQLGMELVNSGLLEVYRTNKIDVNKILQFLICSRSWSGTCLEHLDEKLLLNEFLISPKKRTEYKEQIVENSNALKLALKENRRIEINAELCYSPVVIFRISNYEKNDYEKLLHKWQAYQKEHNFYSYKGTSLGFRYLRMEIIEPKEGAALRISTGYYKGKVFYKLIDFFKENT